MPGLIETHAHLNESHGEKLGRIFLSYGITTVRNPATNPYIAMENRESMDAGVRLGPRVFTTGYTFDGSRIYYAGSGTMHDEKQVHAELQDYVNAGLTPFEALQTRPPSLPSLSAQPAIWAALKQTSLPTSSSWTAIRLPTSRMHVKFAA
jgi:hypothetical protein